MLRSGIKLAQAQTKAPNVSCFFEQVTNTAQYVVSCPTTLSSAIIDPVLDYNNFSGKTTTTSADELLDFVKSNKLNVNYLLETHIHADHVTSATYLKQELKRMGHNPQICISKNVTKVQQVFGDKYNLDILRDGSQFDKLLHDNEKLELGELELTILETPGHTPACLSFLFEDQCIFVGDTIFMVMCDFAFVILFFFNPFFFFL